MDGDLNQGERSPFIPFARSHYLRERGRFRHVDHLEGRNQGQQRAESGGDAPDADRLPGGRASPGLGRAEGRAHGGATRAASWRASWLDEGSDSGGSAGGGVFWILPAFNLGVLALELAYQVCADKGWLEVKAGKDGRR